MYLSTTVRPINEISHDDVTSSRIDVRPILLRSITIGKKISLPPY